VSDTGPMGLLLCAWLRY